MRIPALALSLLIGTAALAQSPSKAHELFRRATVIDFDDDLIEGCTLAEGMEVVSTLRPTEHRSIIRVPEEFRSKVLASLPNP